MSDREPIKQEEIDFIRPRIKESGWYYRGYSADEIANNAIDDLGVCLQRIDELEQALKAAIATDCDCLLANIKPPCSHDLEWWRLRAQYRQTI